MKVIASTDEYTIYQKRNERYAVRDSNRAWVNGDAKIAILIEHKLIEAAQPKAPEPAAAEEAAPVAEEAAPVAEEAAPVAEAAAPEAEAAAPEAEAAAPEETASEAAASEAAASEEAGGEEATAEGGEEGEEKPSGA